jgi:hypothetical protein
MQAAVDLASLLARLKGDAATDTDLGCDLCRAFIGRPDYPEIASLIMAATSGGIEALGAAARLVDVLLPGWDHIVGRTNGGLTVHAQVGPNQMEFAETLAEALLAATLVALSQEQDHVV